MSAARPPLLQVEGLTRDFRVHDADGLWRRNGIRTVRAVADVSFTLGPGTVLGIVGESGSGKTTLARLLLRLVEPTSGKVLLHGRDIFTMAPDEIAALLRPKIRMIFQHPDAVLNPGYPVGVALARALQLHGTSAESIPARIHELLESVGLDPALASRYPDDLSGGQKRRIGICRALSTSPDIIIADEALSGLDVLLQEQILAVLAQEQRKRGFTLIMISHDLERVNQICDRVLVMHSGHVVEDLSIRREDGVARDQFMHPYGALLQRSRLDMCRRDATILAPTIVLNHDHGIGPDPEAAAGGCPCVSTCDLHVELGRPNSCSSEAPALRQIRPGHHVACHMVEEAVEVVALP